jgi:hypothetical protein
MAKTKVGNMLKSAQKSFLKLNYGALLHNCYVMYFVLFLAVADLLVLSVGREYVFVLIFLLVGYLTSFFSKNMMVILLVAIVATNVLRSGSGIRLSEGLENAEEEEKPVESLENAEEEDKEKPVESLENADGEEDKPEEDKKEKKPEDAKPKTTESFDLKTKNATSLTSSPIEGLDVLGDQTAQLISTQKKLMENMKTLEPMLTQAEKFMSQFENIESKVSGK